MTAGESGLVWIATDPDILVPVEPELRSWRRDTRETRPETVSGEPYPEYKSPVVAEALYRAEGHCDLCGVEAPFARLSDGSPSLEVHHCVSLSAGGEDTVQNALAVGPTCHRRLHHLVVMMRRPKR